MRLSVSVHTFLLVLTLALTPMVSFAGSVWIDVRTKAEHQQSNIEGDPLIPHTEIVAGVSEQYPDKDTEINLYCRSGNRAGIAKSSLEKAGYTNVNNMGGIADAREVRDL